MLTSQVVELDKDADKPLGIDLSESSLTGAVLVDAISETSPALGFLRVGDVLLSINGVEIEGAKQAAENLGKGSALKLRIQPANTMVSSCCGTEISAACSEHSQTWRPLVLCALCFVLPLLFTSLSFQSQAAHQQELQQQVQSVNKLHKTWQDMHTKALRDVAELKKENAHVRNQSTASKRETQQALERLAEQTRSSAMLAHQRASLLRNITSLKSELEGTKRAHRAEMTQTGAVQKSLSKSNSEYKQSIAERDVQLVHREGEIRDIRARKNATMSSHLERDAQVRARLVSLEASFKAAIAEIDESSAIAQAPAPPPPPRTAMKRLRPPPVKGHGGDLRR
jgi:hypothetical protein